MEKEYKSQWDVEPLVVTTPLQDKLKVNCPDHGSGTMVKILQKFEELKQRRKQVCGKSTAKRVNHIRQQATEAGKVILEMQFQLLTCCHYKYCQNFTDPMFYKISDMVLGATVSIRESEEDDQKSSQKTKVVINQ